MELASRENPNVCVGCAQLLDDIFPIQAAANLSDNTRTQRAATRDDDGVAIYSDLGAYEPTAVATRVADEAGLFDASSNALGQRK